MQLHELKPKKKIKKAKRVGRGGKRGTYSGRGQKGQKSRAGRNLKPAIRGWIKRYPKLKGYEFNPQTSRYKMASAIVNLAILEKNFDNNQEINPKILLEKGIVGKIKGRLPKVKILGKGKLTKKLTVKGCLISKQAKEVIEAAGGKVE